MKYTLNEKQDNQIKIDFVLSAEEWEKEVEHAYQHNKGKYNKEGFRKGNVPRPILEKTYGETMFYEDAINECFPKYYMEMLSKEKELYPVDYPELSVQKMDKNGVEFSATIVVLPEFEVKNYKGIKVKKDKVSVSKEEVEKEIDSLRERHARFVEVTNRAVKEGDLINLNYSGKLDGVKFDGGTAEDQELTIGSHTFIPGFEEQMVGMTIGEEKDIDVTFPTEYHSKELAGKAVVFTVKVLGIREKELPTVDDEFAKEVSEFETLEELKKDTEEKIKHQKDHQAQHKAEETLISTIVDGVELAVPTQMVEKQLNHMVNDLNARLSAQGFTKEAYFEFMGTTEEAFKKERANDAEKSVKTSLVLEAIVENEKIEVTEDEVNSKVEELATMYSQKAEVIKQMLGNEGLVSIKQELLTNKVINFLKENNEIA